MRRAALYLSIMVVILASSAWSQRGPQLDLGEALRIKLQATTEEWSVILPLLQKIDAARGTIQAVENPLEATGPEGRGRGPAGRNNAFDGPEDMRPGEGQRGPPPGRGAEPPGLADIPGIRGLIDMARGPAPARPGERGTGGTASASTNPATAAATTRTATSDQVKASANAKTLKKAQEEISRAQSALRLLLSQDQQAILKMLGYLEEPGP